MTCSTEGRVVCQSEKCQGMKWSIGQLHVGHWVIVRSLTNPRHLPYGSAFSMAFLVNNPGVNAGHCGVFPSLWCLVGACSNEVRRQWGQVSRPHWPDSPGMLSVSESSMITRSPEQLTQTLRDDNADQYRVLKYQTSVLKLGEQNPLWMTSKKDRLLHSASLV